MKGSTHQIAIVFKDIHEMGSMADVFKENRIINSVVIQALLEANDLNTSIDFCDQILPTSIAHISYLIFSQALKNIKYYSNAISCLIKLREKISSTDTQQKTFQQNSFINETVFISLDEKIYPDYYINSLLQDEIQLLDLACTKNPQKFMEMFCHELKSFGTITSSDDSDEHEENTTLIKSLKHRELFYRNLMKHRDMISFYHYEKCLSFVNDTFDEFNLKPIAKAESIKISMPTADLFSLEDDFQKKQKNAEDVSSISTKKQSKTEVSTQKTTNGFSNFLNSVSDFFTPKPAEKKEEKEMKPIKPNKNDQIYHSPMKMRNLLHEIKK